MKATKALAALAISVLALTGCTGPGGTPAAPGGSGAALAPMTNPDEAAEGKDFTDVRTSLGAVPKVTGDIKLGGVAKAFENEYWRTLKEGMEIGAQKMTQLGAMNVTIDMRSAQGESDEQGQLAIAKDMINKKYSALLLSPISDGNLVPAVEDATKAGIPVVNVNDGIIANAPNYVGPRAKRNGSSAAEWISKKLNGEGEVAIVIGLPKAFAARQRTAASRST